MGPIALFDKSFLQSLSVDEAIWFDHFFIPIVCPIFFVETLADLSKTPRSGRSPESEVRIIASKFPEFSGSPCANHLHMAVSNLLGHPIPMTCQIPRAGGRYVQKAGRPGVVFDHSPEDAAFMRWQEGKFLDVERAFAAKWRADLNSLNFKEIVSAINKYGIDAKSCKSFADAKAIADQVISSPSGHLERIGFAVNFFGITHEHHATIIKNWESGGRRSLIDFAPFAAYVLTVELFFHIALGARLLAPDRPSNRTDIAYLCYLPFCHFFVSFDHLHRDAAKVFLRHDQEFVPGDELKQDLKRINEHFLSLPESDKERGIVKFASRPPATGEFMVTNLWERFLRRGVLPKDGETEKLSPEAEKKLVDNFNEWKSAQSTKAPHNLARNQDLDMVAIERRVSKKRGSWWQLPKDFPDPK